MSTEKKIVLRGVRTHNLDSIDLEIPHGQFLAICGVSGSGKTSLAIDTLYAEGQRRYIESFSPYARQYLDQVEKPPAEKLLGIPPSIAVVNRHGKFGRRSTLASVVELNSLLQLLFTKAATIVCPVCNLSVARVQAGGIVEWIQNLPDGARLQIGFPIPTLDAQERDRLTAAGFVRTIANGKTRNLAELPDDVSLIHASIIVDRLSSDKIDPQRLPDSINTAMQFGEGAVQIWHNAEQPASERDLQPESIDGSLWRLVNFHRDLVCPKCGLKFADPEPQFFSDSSPLGACEECEGLGEVSAYDIRRIVPDESLSIAQGAVAPWNSPSYVHERDELLALAAEHNIDTNLPWKDLSESNKELIWNGVPENKFGGLAGFFRWLEKRRYKMHLRIFAARWRSFSICKTCHGDRLRTSVKIYQFGSMSIVDVYQMTIEQAANFLRENEGSRKSSALESVFRHLLELLDGLTALGLGYLRLDRPMQSLSAGERQRVLIGRMLRTSLVNLVYVFDEPTGGMHDIDSRTVIDAISSLHKRNNTLVVVDHNPKLLMAAERIMELGPGAGEQGGKIVFDGTLDKLQRTKSSPTGKSSKNPNGELIERTRRKPRASRLRLLGCTGRNLKAIDVNFPTGVLCQVVGVSGSGKATLVRDTLYAALAQHFKESNALPLPFRKLVGEDQFDNVVLIDDSPLVRSARSNPATFIQVYDLIRKLLADTEQAQARQMTARHFSFNVTGGRCDKCKGTGFLDVDMHFLTDMRTVCDECGGRRFRNEVLGVKYRGLNVIEILKLTAHQAFPFFRGQRKIQVAIKSLLDVGLGYLQLGQPNDTLSSGEERRLRLAQHLAQTTKGRSLFIALRPTVGLHPIEIPKLVDCLESLLNVGHSLIVVDNAIGLCDYADWIIELGSGAGAAGGNLIFEGTPEQLRESNESSMRRELQGMN